MTIRWPRAILSGAAKRMIADGYVSRSAGALPAGGDGRFIGLAATCAAAAGALFLVDSATASASQRPAHLLVAALLGGTLLAAASFLRRGFAPRVLIAAGVMLMALGVAVGALLPATLDAAILLPLAGAALALPAARGRPLLVLLALAFGASMAAGTIVRFGGETTGSATPFDAWLSLLESGVILAFIYGLLWWVGDRGWRSDERARLSLASRRRLLEVNDSLLSTLDPQGVFELIADSLKAVVAYDNLTIYRVDRSDAVLRPVLARDRFAQLIMGSTMPIDRGLTGWVVAHGTAECVNDAIHDPRISVIPGTPNEAESLIVVPLLVGGEVAGTLNVGRMGQEEAHFSPEEFELARLFAGQASIALRNAETLRAVATRAETDALTGLRNRGSFDDRLAALIADPRVQPLVLVMLDLDGFKHYNDVHGHPAGDALLQAAGRAISTSVRDGDLCFRYGGDEFALLLPGTNQEDAGQIAERVRLAVAAVGSSGTSRVTASVGLGSLPADVQTAEALIAATDAALYGAKGSGGDRVETSGDPQTASGGRPGRASEGLAPMRTADWLPGASTARRRSPSRRAKRGALGSRRRSGAGEKSGAAQRLRTALDTMLEGVTIQSAVRDESGRIVDFRIDYSNAAIGRIGRVASGEKAGRTLLELFPAHRANGLFEAYVRVVETGAPFESGGFRYVDPDAAGGPLDQILDLRAARRGDGYVLSVRDVTEHNHAEAEMRRLSTAIEQSADPVVITDADARIEYVNPAFERVTGYTRDEVLGQNPRILKSGAHGPAFYHAMWATLTSGHPFSANMTNRRKDGSLFQEQTVISPVLDSDGRITSYVEVKRDITRERGYEAAQERQARERALIAVALGDLEAQPTPAATAELICRHVVRLAGLATATLLYFAVGGPATPLAFVRQDGAPVPLRRVPFQRSRRLHERAGEGPWVETWIRRPWHPYDLLFRDLGVQATAYAPVRHGGQLIGLLIASSAEADAISLLTEHLPAIFEFAGIAGVLVGPSMVTLTETGFAREAIQQIVRDQAFEPFFQPIVDIATGAHVGFEALTRFTNGTPPADVFLNAHACGLEAELEEATLAAALSAAAALPHGTWLSLNVSPDLATTGRLEGLLAHSTRPLVLEVTEHALVNDYAALRVAIDRIYPAVRLAVDDTGAGVANFGHLVELRPAFVKLDISLVRGIDSDRTRQALIVGLVHFARESASQTIAEGVETDAELDTLRTLGVPLAQGYLLGSPAPVGHWQE